jgi:integrase
MLNGRRWRVNLRVPVFGRRPGGPGDAGDDAFRKSKRAAQDAHDARLAELRARQSEVELRRKLLEAKAGVPVRFPPVSEIAKRWAGLKRKRSVSARYIAAGCDKLDAFARFMASRHPDVTDLAGVRGEHVEAFMDEREASGISARTWNYTFGTIKAAFRKLCPDAPAVRDFLGSTPQKAESTVHREPFTSEELAAVLDAAKGDPLIRAMAIAAACTGMRRSDCARLRWDNVDLGAGFITVKTMKTGETAEIPVLPALRDVLAAADRSGEYVFPEAERMLRESPSRLDARLKAVLRAAGFVDARRAHAAPPGEPVRGLLQADGNSAQRQRRGSVKGWHSFRTTFITVALSSGVPVELVCRVTGHRSVGVVQKHYLRPGREHLAAAILRAMPKILTAGAKSRDDRLREVVAKMGPLALRYRALAILDGKG